MARLLEQNGRGDEVRHRVANSFSGQSSHPRLVGSQTDKERTNIDPKSNGVGSPAGIITVRGPVVFAVEVRCVNLD
jgi:hypothetical protein